MLSALDAGIAGLNSASERFNTAATKIANARPVPAAIAAQGGQGPGSEDVVSLAQNLAAPSNDDDIAKNLVDAKIASYDFKANLKVIQVADKVLQNTLDIIS